jgi:hypothetical protein
MTKPPLSSEQKPSRLGETIDRAHRLDFIFNLILAVWTVASVMAAMVLKAYIALGPGTTILIALGIALLGTQLPNLFKWGRQRLYHGGIFSLSSIGTTATSLAMALMVLVGNHFILGTTPQNQSQEHPTSPSDLAAQPRSYGQNLVTA